MLEHPTRRDEAMRYWLIMQASAEEMPFGERKAELEMLAHHCQSDTLRGVCEKSLDMTRRRPVRQRLGELAVK